MIHYREHTVDHPLLAQHVLYYSSIASDEALSYFCIPNGLVGMSFVLSGHVAIRTHDEIEPLPSNYLFGMVSRPTEVMLSERTRIFTAVLKSESLHRFIQVPAHEVLNRAIDLSDIFGGSCKWLLKPLHEAQHFVILLAAVERLLLKVYHANADNNKPGR